MQNFAQFGHLPLADTSSCLQVLLRGRVATVRGKGKSCFIVLRQRTATIQVLLLHFCDYQQAGKSVFFYLWHGHQRWLLQVVLFTNDKTISKGMVKYASNLSRESIIDVEGTVVVPQEPVVACTQSQVQRQYLSTRDYHA